MLLSIYTVFSCQRLRDRGERERGREGEHTLQMGHRHAAVPFAFLHPAQIWGMHVHVWSNCGWLCAIQLPLATSLRGQPCICFCFKD